MEFPELGKKCNAEGCGQLDFLPLICSNCKLLFCALHHLTSAHDCKKLNVFFEKQTSDSPLEFIACTAPDCADKSPINLPCSKCQKHYCVSHRHHGCLDELATSERRKAKVEEFKRPKQQFNALKEEADKRTEQNLRKAECNSSSKSLALRVRLMKIKSKALGCNKIPPEKRAYFEVHLPVQPQHNANADYKARPLFAHTDWNVGRCIDAFCARLKIVNRNNEAGAPKLRLFKLSDGAVLPNDAKMGDLIVRKDLIDGESLVLMHVPSDGGNSEDVFVPRELLTEYKAAGI